MLYVLSWRLPLECKTAVPVPIIILFISIIYVDECEDTSSIINTYVRINVSIVRGYLHSKGRDITEILLIMLRKSTELDNERFACSKILIKRNIEGKRAINPSLSGHLVREM